MMGLGVITLIFILSSQSYESRKNTLNIDFIL